MPKIKKYLVKSPVENFVGVGAGGVQFAYGQAEVNEGWVLDWYREKGFKITEIANEESAPKSIYEMSMVELKQEAASKGYEVTSKTTKAELIAHLDPDHV